MTSFGKSAFIKVAGKAGLLMESFFVCQPPALVTSSQRGFMVEKLNTLHFRPPDSLAASSHLHLLLSQDFISPV